MPPAILVDVLRRGVGAHERVHHLSVRDAALGVVLRDVFGDPVLAGTHLRLDRPERLADGHAGSLCGDRPFVNS